MKYVRIFPKTSTISEIANGFGSHRGVYPHAGGTRRTVCIEFSGQKPIGDFEEEKKKFLHMNQKGIIYIAVIVIVVAIAGAIGYFTLVKKQTSPVEMNQPQETNTPVTPQPPTTNNPSQTPPPATPQNISQNNNIDDCNLISNSSFRSINQYEVGLGPNGPVMGYWRIQFQKGTTLSEYGKPTFQWHHSDVSESGTYTCKDNILQVKFSDYAIAAHYDGSKKILKWDGVEYKKVE